MRFPPVLVVLSFAIVAKAQNLTSYLPECALPCVKQTLNSTKLCANIDDNKCLCENASQIIFPSRLCFVQSCESSNPVELRSEITSGWEKFCNDSGTPISLATGGGPVPSPFPTSSVTSSTLPTSSSTASSDTIPPAPKSGLSTGAKAGIGVGAGVGSLVVIGGLVFLGFRLGRKRRANNAGGESIPPLNEGIHPGNGQSAILPDTTTTWTTAEGGGDNWAYKPQPAFAELPAHGGGVTELPVSERPAELWHGVMPPELSTDGEIPRTASTTRL
ncbi:hypothetical protein E0Z10_g7327 [Xylaria hypoxylon]|uniref:CFEM domain-containing protein n=1 Tax=Xylaria hypoxylon TaxID=37992 RepID=A0A4Z0YPT7_9PEZI|nr:hypothetical protein E0Z10_g7327 [Xylaria hypoxylon]